ncbi:hypothetical protein BX666DRAFT_897481 [Dichotomocladium elegans]|nr:hypothetical protein BX666DRAFT_897481 [Dichotomocladium elegans]
MMGQSIGGHHRLHVFVQLIAHGLFFFLLLKRSTPAFFLVKFASSFFPIFFFFESVCERMQNMVEEYRLPGGYFPNGVNEEETMCSQLPLAIVSSVLFPGNARAILAMKPQPRLAAASSLPGAWVQELKPSTAGGATKAIPALSVSTPTPIEVRPVDETDDICAKNKSSPQVGDEEQKAVELRRTVAELRQQAEQLEQADRMVKKGLEVIAQKRVLAQHKRRRRSQWDWCDDIEGGNAEGVESTSEEEETTRTALRPKTSRAEEDDWVWIDEVTTPCSLAISPSKACTHMPCTVYQRTYQW